MCTGNYIFVPYMITPHNKVYCCDSSFVKGLTELMPPGFESLLGPICLPLVDRFIQLLKVAQASSGWVVFLYTHVKRRYSGWQDKCQPLLPSVQKNWYLIVQLGQIDVCIDDCSIGTCSAHTLWESCGARKTSARDLSRIADVMLFLCSQYFRESILNDIRKARTLYTGKELAAELARIRQRVDNVEVLSADIVINLLLSYRDIQVGVLCNTKSSKLNYILTEFFLVYFADFF